MSNEKPLHVRVAEALGWPFPDAQLSDPANWAAVPRYDTDWSATGPLIEKYGIVLIPEWHMTNPPKVAGWTARRLEERSDWSMSALVAVCGMILALSEAGKLPK